MKLHLFRLTCYHESSGGVSEEMFRVVFMQSVVFLAPWPVAFRSPVRKLRTGPCPPESGAACLFHREPGKTQRTPPLPTLRYHHRDRASDMALFYLPLVQSVGCRCMRRCITFLILAYTFWLHVQTEAHMHALTCSAISATCGWKTRRCVGGKGAMRHAGERWKEGDAEGSERGGWGVFAPWEEP